MYHAEFVRAVSIAYGHVCSLRKTALMFNIGLSTIKRWKSAGWARTQVRGPRKCTPDVIEFIKGYAVQHPFTTCTAIASILLQTLGVSVSRHLVALALQRAGITKVRSRPGVPVSSQQRQRDALSAFHTRLEQCIVDGRHIVSVDETGVDERTVPISGYVQQGSRLYVQRRTGGWKRTNVIMAVDANGVVSSTTCQTAVGSQAFAAFIDDLPVPKGAVLMMDNVAFHKTAAVQAALRRKGYQALYTPPYTPDTNPIENIFSIFKHHVRRESWETSVVERVARGLQALTECPATVFAACFRRSLEWTRQHA
jgi:transposase